MGDTPHDRPTADEPTDRPTDDVDMTGVHSARVKYVRAVADGHETPRAVADETGINYSNVCQQLRKCKNNPENPVAGEKTAEGWNFWIGGPTADEPTGSADTDDTGRQETADTEDDGKIPVSRDYDFKSKIPSPGTEYIGGEEYARLRAEFSEPMRKVADEPVSARLVGPTGSGKTLLVESLAAENGWPVFTVQVNMDMQGSDLTGYPVESKDGHLQFHDGVLTKALLSSQERPTVLLVDEVNRAPDEAKSVLYPALDSRCQVSLDMRDGEVVKGDPENLIVISTMNKGRDYSVEPLRDPAAVRRFGGAEPIDYVGRSDPNAERDILTAKTPVSDRYAELVVSAANDVRDTAERKGTVLATPTPALIDMCMWAAAYKRADMAEPSDMAVKKLIRTYYGDSRDENLVRTSYMNRVGGVDPIDTADETADTGAGSDRDMRVILPDGSETESPAELLISEIWPDGRGGMTGAGAPIRTTDDADIDDTYPVKDDIKAIKGSYYHPDGETWTIPADTLADGAETLAAKTGMTVGITGTVAADERTDVNGGEI